MKRDKLIDKIADDSQVWDIIVIGGGATGLGIAVDAATRGHKTVLLEQSDFTKSTSSRSTKLVHGGVRYLAQGDVKMVIEALRERGRMKANAPHLVMDQKFIIGNYKWWERPFYTIGLVMYDLLAGKLGLGRSLALKKKTVIKEIPQISRKGLKGGVLYHDGQFDDSRLAINLLQTSVENGCVAINYIKVNQLLKNDLGIINGVEAKDEISGKVYKLKSKVVINATGIFVDEIMQMDAPEKKALVRPSQGVHVVVDKSFLGGDTAIMIPKTSDGRVLFCVPWHGKVVLGTTDTPLNEFTLEPKALEEEINFILKTAGEYLEKQPTREDALSVFAGLRPLAAPHDSSDGSEKKTKEISRSHKLITSKSGLVTITGGKWTTYRLMAEETINKAETISELEQRECITKDLKIHGYKEDVDRSSYAYVYGSDLENIKKLYEENNEWAKQLHPRLDFTGAEVIWAVREEMAITLEDVLARRVRALFLDARAAIDIAPLVASIMAKELGHSKEWEDKQVEKFVQLAQNYLLVPYPSKG